MAWDSAKALYFLAISRLKPEKDTLLLFPHVFNLISNFPSLWTNNQCCVYKLYTRFSLDY